MTAPTPAPGSLADLLMELGAPYMGAPSPATPGDTAAVPKEPLTAEQMRGLEQLRTLILPLLQPQPAPLMILPEQTGAGESSGGGGGSGDSAR